MRLRHWTGDKRAVWVDVEEERDVWIVISNDQRGDIGIRTAETAPKCESHQNYKSY